MRRRETLVPLATTLGLLLTLTAWGCGGGAKPAADAGGDKAGTAQTDDGSAAAALDNGPASGDATGGTDTTTTGGAIDSTTTGGDVPVQFDAAGMYNNNCAGCHGPQGEGVEQKGPPYSKVLHDPDPELVEVVLNGKDKKMPAFGDKISKEDATLLVAWIRKELGGGMQPSEGGDEAKEGDEGTEG